MFLEFLYHFRSPFRNRFLYAYDFTMRIVAVHDAPEVRNAEGLDVAFLRRQGKLNKIHRCRLSGLPVKLKHGRLGWLYPGYVLTVEMANDRLGKG